LNQDLSIPFHRPSIGQEEIDEVVATLRSGWLTTGPRTAQFEQEFGAYVRAPHALAVNSCTAGLHLALAALKIGPGDEVITTPLTFCATVNTIFHVGATPILADVGPDGNIDPSAIAERMTDRTRAVIPVHLAGLPCDMEAIWSLARRYGLNVVEDAAHATGSHYRGMPIGGADPATGARSDVVAYSFYATKNLTTGEGGMVTTHDQSLAEAMRCLCLHGISKDAWNRYADRGNWYYEVLACGFKYNLSDIQAAIGLHQLRKLERFIEMRRRLAHRYHSGLLNVAEVEVPPDATRGRNAWHLYMLRLNRQRLSIDRAEFIRALLQKGIGASVHFIPIPMHPFFAEHAARPQNYCPRSLELYSRLVSLPLYPGMTEEQVDYVVDAVKQISWAARRKTSIALATDGVGVPVP
jgi:dTDP-4-amino-4,6-dideoxygalactose transaminase